MESEPRAESDPRQDWGGLEWAVLGASLVTPGRRDRDQAVETDGEGHASGEQESLDLGTCGTLTPEEQTP